MKILGLTGSIAMGKSTTASLFRSLGVPVHDADKAVHALMGPGGAATPLIDHAFPGVVDQGTVNRKKLGVLAFANPAVLDRLETILHPMVHAMERAFLNSERRNGRSLVVLDIPLLFETGGHTRCDAVAVVTAPAFLQKQRASARGLTNERLAQVLARQMPDAEKRRRADVLIQTGLGKAHALRTCRNIVTLMTSKPGV